MQGQAEAKAITVCYRDQTPCGVFNVPEGFVLYCRDYDVEHVDVEDLLLDANGDEYLLTTWSPHGTRGAPSARQSNQPTRNLQMKRCNTYSLFFRALRSARLKGWEMEALDTPVCIKNNQGKGKVSSHLIIHRAKNNALLLPDEVVCRAFYSQVTDPHKLSTIAALHIGLPENKWSKLSAAIRESRGHSKALRRRLLKACGLVEVLHSQRPRRRKHERQRKRKRKENK